MSNSNNWLSRKITAFKKMPKEDKTTIFVFGVLITLLIAAIVIAVVLISSMKNKPKPVNSLPVVATADSENLDADYNAKDYVIDDDKFKDTLLPLSEDAGKKYLEDTLFVGDSNTQRLFTYGLCTLQNVLAQEGMSVGGVTSFAGFYFQGMENGVTIPRAIAMLQPRRIVFNFGTNNAGNSIKTEEFIKAYSDALLAIKAEYPYSDIILATIPPVGEKRDYNNVSMKAIDAFNEAIVNYAQKEGYKVLNYNEFLKDEDTGYIKAEYVVGDGLHLTQEALKKQLKFVRTHAYETEDTRPKLKAIPQRRKSPVVQTAPPTDGGTTTANKESVTISFVTETQSKAGNVIAEVGGFITSSDGATVQTVMPLQSTKAMTAVANPGYTFAGWFWGSKLSGEASIVFTVPENMTEKTVGIKAVFVRNTDPTPTPTPTPTEPPVVIPTPVSPTPVAPTPVAPTPVAPTPVAPTPVAPTPVAPTPASTPPETSSDTSTVQP